MKQIGINEYFPPLPKVDLLLYRSPGQATSAAMALHEYLAHYLGVFSDARAALEAGTEQFRPAPAPAKPALRPSAALEEARPAA
jgi:hypothetical protein